MNPEGIWFFLGCLLGAVLMLLTVTQRYTIIDDMTHDHHCKGIVDNWTPTNSHVTCQLK